MSGQSIKLTKNLHFITTKRGYVKVVDLRITAPQDRPLLILMAWIGAKPKHVNKFVTFYVDQGFDVLSVNIAHWQLALPESGSQVIAEDVIKFLNVNRSYAPLALHGFSVASYLWGEVLVKIENEKARYQHIVDRIVGQVWDSAADIIKKSPNSFAFTLFPGNRVIQYVLRTYIMFHLKIFYEETTRHYVSSEQAFQNNVVHAPALFFVSKTDLIGTEQWNIQARDNWISMGMEVHWKCWDDSPHVQHYRTHPEEYMEELIAFLNSLGLLASLEKLPAKL